MNIYEDYFDLLAHAPDKELDASISAKFKKMDPHKFTSDQILEIIDECVDRGALAGLPAITILDELWRLKLDDEGKTIEQSLKDAEPRRTTPKHRKN